MTKPQQLKTTIKLSDIVIGIPSYNEANNIGFVVKIVDDGLQKYFKKYQSVIINVDNNSPDNTKDEFLRANTKTPKLYISTPAEIKGKGNNFLNLFKKAVELKAKVVIVVDADLKSITPEWIIKLGEPILDGYSYATPIYVRNEYDGTITNNICYPLIYGILGINIRQPIGGEFACSNKLIEYYLNQKWTETIKQYGIDIFMTMNAILGEFKIAQVNLGAKIHKPSAPKLGAMFSEVVETIFSILLNNKDKWLKLDTKKISTPQITSKLIKTKPQELSVNYKAIKETAKSEFKKNKKNLETFLPERIYAKINNMYIDKNIITINNDLWSKSVYSLLAAYEKNKHNVKIIEALKPLYFGRALTFIKETMELNSDESEKFIQEQAKVFRENRNYLFGLLLK